MSARPNNLGVNAFALFLVAGAIGLLVFKQVGGGVRGAKVQLLNVSYDPTRELYAELNPRFAAQYLRDTGTTVAITQSHGGSSRQAKRVADGSEAADVVTLALPSDINLLRTRKLVADDWPTHFPQNSQPYYSTIVFVVRRDNPKHVHDWLDLTVPGIEVITPNPETSGNGKLSVLAAWGSVIYRGGTDAEARDLVSKLYRNVSNLAEGARGSTTTFELAKEGDVQLTWENEAIREVAESNGDLSIVYPPVSIRAEPSVALVTRNTAKRNTDAVSTAYLHYLYSDEAQELLAKDGYRPENAAILTQHQALLPKVELFPITTIAQDWDDAQYKFFGDNGLFNAIHAATH